MILDEIYAHKLKEIAERRHRLPLNALERKALKLPPARDLEATLRQGKGLKLIAEIKARSPSAGTLRRNFSPKKIASEYERWGASAISVLTDRKFFHGSPSHLEEIRKVVNLPLLCKDFIIDPYQLYEARAHGADAVLLIATLLSEGEIKDFLRLSRHLGLQCLVEVHSEEELKLVLDLGASLLGINNRDLRTFSVDLKTTLRLRPLIPKGRLVVSESGISTREDVLLLQKAGVNAILIGEALMRSRDIGLKIRELMGWQKRDLPLYSSGT